MDILKAAGLIILVLFLALGTLSVAIVLFLNFSAVVGKNRSREEMDHLYGDLPHYSDGAFHNFQKQPVAVVARDASCGAESSQGPRFCP